MACDCIESLNKKLLEEANEPASKIRRPKGAVTCKSVSFANSALNFSTGKLVYLLPFVIDWELSKGDFKEMETKIEMSHCPFCGTEFQKS